MFDGTLLRQKRLEKKMTQQALGDLVGLSASAVGMYETSRRLPDVDTLYRISAVLGIPADRFFTGLPHPSGTDRFPQRDAGERGSGDPLRPSSELGGPAALFLPPPPRRQ